VYEIRSFEVDDFERLKEICLLAFGPIHESFRDFVGHDIFEHVYSDWEEKQIEYLKSICEPDSGKEVMVVRNDNGIVGFICFSMDVAKQCVGIYLNAVHPDYASKGIGKTMYEFVLSKMRMAGIKLVKVSTGGDASHAPARRAYKRAGFKAAIPSVTMFMLL
jgi:GNAT superfamily N-acetyltransferase